MGSHSGRDENKVKNAGLTPLFVEGTTAFDDAKMIFICRKLYHAPLQESGFTSQQVVRENYPQRDFHEMYVGEILKVLVKENS
ncbi:MAG: hypothetical protein ACRDBM_03585 [Sporomusa sp.]